MEGRTMKTPVTILSGGKTRELFSQLDKSNPTKVANAQSNYAGVSLSLRYCYKREMGFWDKLTYNVRIIPTGGLLLSWYIEGIPPGYSKISSGKVRIKPDGTEGQRRAVSRAITRILRMAHEEKARVAAVKSLDDICSPFGSNEEFIAFVEKWEERDGKQSDYQSLSREDVELWKQRIEDYDPPQHQVEGTYPNFNRYIAGDR
jgi:hypothetical protein